MREILFRAKKKMPNGKTAWVYGDLTHLGGDVQIYGNEHDHYLGVDPATVGQYTGLTDKNGRQIFEGDILRHDDGDMGVVDFDEGCYIVAWNGADESLLRDTCLSFCEVIGNINDTPNKEKTQ